MATEDPPVPMEVAKQSSREKGSTDPSKPSATPPKKIHLGTLFKYSTKNEKILLAIATFCAFAEGAAMPGFTFVFGAVLDTVGQNPADLPNKINILALAMLGIAVAVFILGSIWSGLFNFTAVRQANRIRRAYFASVLSKDVSWFDTHTPGEIPTRLSNEIDKFQNAVGQKAGMAIMNVCQALSGMLLGFIQGWQVALVVLAGLPFIAVAMVFLTRAMSKASSDAQTSYAKAGAVTEEVFSSIRTVAAFGGELFELNRYTLELGEAKKSGIKIGLHIGLSLGGVMMITFFSYALTFWFGSWLISNNIINDITGEPWTGAQVIVVFFSVLMGTFGLGQIGPSITALAEGTAALKLLYETIESESDIEPTLLRKRTDGALVCSKPWKFTEEMKAIFQKIDSIRFENITFNYPSRPDVVVLDNLSLSIDGCQKIALVGESGSGKSTIISLLERFYDPAAGTVLINNIDIRTLNPHDLRSIFGYVGQEPVMFATSIRGNLTYGMKESEIPNESALLDALKKANVYQFITSLPDGLDTFCGSGGSQMSGGQKQRIAIARALLRKPKILLLDEATSALDNESEKLVQYTIDSLQSQMGGDLTTISVAHRLSTIRNSDVIFVLRKGHIVERGSHVELMGIENGVYKALVATQVDQTSGLSEMILVPEESLSLPSSAAAENTFASAKESVTGKQPLPVSPHGHLLSGKTTEQIEKERIQKINKSYSIPWKRLWEYSRPEKFLYIPAIFGAFIKGAAFPIHSVIFSAVISWYYLKTDLMKKVAVASLEYVALGVAVFGGIVLDLWIFSIISEAFTLRIREACFRHILSQDISFFDKSENTPARLQLALSTWTSKMNAITTNVIGVYCEVFSALVAGLIIAFLASPKLAAVLLATLPIVVGTASVATSAMLKIKDDANMAQQAAQVASEAVQNMRTVRALNAESETLFLYENLSMKRTVLEQKRAWSNGLIFGFSMGAIFLPYSLGYWYGGILVANNELDLQNLTQALIGLLLSAMGAGQALSFMADVAVAKAAAHDVFELLDTPSKISPFDHSHESAAMVVGTGKIEFHNVYFAYPSRPEVPILCGLTFSVVEGQKIALVGPSGGGKSTVMALLLRFYDPQEGKITFDGVDSRALDVSTLRAAMGYVGQEPVLFDTTMEKNVLYGNRDATKDQLGEVQKLAKLDFVGDENVHWDTTLGPKGGLLSGGQKQRTAIARALIRDPKILLLDEATSALDSASEHVVQKAIDSATIGRTTFVIAHRLSTIQDADRILVIAGGRMVESGSHTELMAKKRAYYQLYMQGQK